MTAITITEAQLRGLQACTNDQVRRHGAQGPWSAPDGVSAQVLDRILRDDLISLEHIDSDPTANGSAMHAARPTATGQALLTFVALRDGQPPAPAAASTVHVDASKKGRASTVQLEQPLQVTLRSHKHGEVRADVTLLNGESLAVTVGHTKKRSFLQVHRENGQLVTKDTVS